MGVEERAARPVCRARGTLTGRGRAYACRAGAVVVEGGRNGFLRFCFAVCPPSPPHLRCFRANGSEVDSPR